jgi:DNA-binding winged helix-turn-helix (wHTH) protein
VGKIDLVRFLLSIANEELDRLFLTLEREGFALVVGRGGDSAAIPSSNGEAPGQILLTPLPSDAGGILPPRVGEAAFANDLITVGDLEIDQRGRRVWRNGVALDLSRREFDLLATLARYPDRVLSKDALMADVWRDTAVTPNAVEVHLSTLRRKLEATGPRLIDTVRGVGYVLRSPSSGDRRRVLVRERERIIADRQRLLDHRQSVVNDREAGRLRRLATRDAPRPAKGGSP